jgi:hypothetical protein
MRKYYHFLNTSLLYYKIHTMQGFFQKTEKFFTFSRLLNNIYDFITIADACLLFAQRNFLPLI